MSKRCKNMKKYILIFLISCCVLILVGCKPTRGVLDTNSPKITLGFGKRNEEPQKPADYKPIPKELSAQYKTEMEKA